MNAFDQGNQGVPIMGLNRKPNIELKQSLPFSFTDVVQPFQNFLEVSENEQDLTDKSLRTSKTWQTRALEFCNRSVMIAK